MHIRIISQASELFYDPIDVNFVKINLQLENLL